MQLTITGHHVEVTPALRAYVTEKMQRLSRHFDKVVTVDVILNVEKHTQLAEATVNAGGRTLFANDNADDMYAAIDGLADKIDRQVRRLKDRLRDHHHEKPDYQAAENI
ncbi:ribosome-associated translation inhibitor RaiA [Marinihelvus fidelis]|uniref:Ribosome hibernation promoting factor n=1 Tax=Marinihelvus fidelis TaxID=2613842 RepID=A0A5N0TEG3_9GAMM|nr:ribosome-associated translation inhibitor RaiA [Marinihelvus fidelis]KAA9133422.1 ribosome-associated translation inhibitor RaiA [Marinihelvus fidelis]